MSDETIPDNQEVETAEVEETREVETEATETETVDEAEETTDADEEGGDDDGEDEEPEEIELKVGGDVLKVPKGAMPEEIRDQVQKFVDSAETSYTRKFQEVAETRKALEAREQAITKIASLNDTQQDLYARGTSIKGEIEQLQGIDLNRLWQSNPDEARRVSDRLSQRQRDFQTVVSQLSQTESEFNRQQEAARAQAAEQGKATIERVVPKFNPDPVIDYVVAEYSKLGQSMSVDEAKSNWSLNPGYAIMAHKAMLYDQQQAKAKTVGGKAPPPKVTTPITAQKGKAAAKSGVVDPDKLSPDQWLKWREKQISKKA
jgi:hypothetical protein